MKYYQLKMTQQDIFYNDKFLQHFRTLRLVLMQCNPRWHSGLVQAPKALYIPKTNSCRWPFDLDIEEKISTTIILWQRINILSSYSSNLNKITDAWVKSRLRTNDNIRHSISLWFCPYFCPFALLPIFHTIFCPQTLPLSLLFMLLE